MTDTMARPAGAAGARARGPARGAMSRWAWRLFRREWRQQLLILALIVVAVGATVVGSAVAVDTPPPATATFGTAQDLATFTRQPSAASQIASIEHRFGPVDVIENQTLRIPGSIDTYDLRAENPDGHFDRPLVSLVSGHYPTGPTQVAMTPGLASSLGLAVGDEWHEGGVVRKVVGTVENPDSLLDAFALVVPGQVASPASVTVLFDAHGVAATKIGPNVRSASAAGTHNALNPTTILLGLATVGMLLIALVAVGGFTVLAQRRLRSIGMLESVGATDKDVGLVVRMNGVVVGVVGAVIGAAVGIAAWLAYRPRVEADAHHQIGVFALPWDVILPAMALAVLATYVAASRPARAITKVPIVTALSGRPAPPREIHRSAVPGVALLVVAFVLFGVASGNKTPVALVAAFVVLIVAVILLAPFFLSLLARMGRNTPVAVRLALRDLSRYRARSGSALAAISLGILIAVIISVVAAGRYGNVLDYAGPNLGSNQLIVYTPTRTSGPGTGSPGTGSPGTGSPGAGTTGTRRPPPTASALRAQSTTARSIAAGLGTRDVVVLETTNATLQHAARGRNYNGPLYLATPALLRAFGISPSAVDPSADILTMRSGLSTLSKMQLLYGSFFTKGPQSPTAPGAFACPKSDCLADPVIQELGSLPSGTSAPNTVVTEHAVRSLHLSVSTAGWFVQAPQSLSPSQIANARLVAAASHMSIETKSSAPSSSEIIDWATVFGIGLALGILAMSVGLVRSETAGDLRTLAAAGAGSRTRRTITAATAGGLGLLGALLGTAGGYVAAFGWFRSTQNTGLSALGHTPTANLLLLVVGMPVLAAAVGWLLSGREPPAMAHQPIE